MDIASYFSCIDEWKKKYGVPINLNISLVDVKLACERCGKLKKNMSRHHKGNDFFFARLFPDVFAKRYIEFRKEDCSRLCDTCHVMVHKYYQPLFHSMMLEFNNPIIVCDIAWCNTWRGVFLAAFERWIRTPVRRRKRKKRKSSLATKGDSHVNKGRRRIRS